MTTPQHREAIAGEVRAATARAGLRAADLALKTGISKAALSRKLRGLTPFYVEELIAISAVVDVEPGALIAATSAAVAAA